MNVQTKIQQLWDYLQVRDDELLIIRSFNATKNANEYIIAKLLKHKIKITRSDIMPDLELNQSFQLIQQIGQDGKYKIPSVEQLKQDELLDY